MELVVQGGSSDSERSWPTRERSYTADLRVEWRAKGEEEFEMVV
jgi:hypothetical protein